MNFHLTIARKLAGLLFALGGGCTFLYGLITFAAHRGQSLQSLGAVLLGYGCALIGVYVHPQLRQLTEDSLAALRRVADRFFDVW